MVVAVFVDGLVDKELEETTELLVLVTDEELDEELETIELLVALDRVEHDTVHADAVPTNMTSCQPPFDQKVSIEEEDPATVGEKVSEIVVLPAAGIVAPLAGNPVAVNALPTTTGLPEVETFWYAAP